MRTPAAMEVNLPIEAHQICVRPRHVTIVVQVRFLERRMGPNLGPLIHWAVDNGGGGMDAGDGSQHGPLSGVGIPVRTLVDRSKHVRCLNDGGYARVRQRLDFGEAQAARPTPS